jgi:UDP-galactopyranose mutase
MVCFSHLRWDFVFQRPQHLFTRFAAERRVFFIEEPVRDSAGRPYLDVAPRSDGLHVVVPHVPASLDAWRVNAVQQRLLTKLLKSANIDRYVAWYYTPMALGFSRHLDPDVIVYDCMDELSGFKRAPPTLLDHERELISRADVVFAGGQSLYEAKRHLHPNVHAFASGIDRAHWDQARRPLPEPADQASIPRPRIGFAGVIDERMDIDLLRAIAEGRPDWHFVLLGPVVKIDPASLPQLPNLHFLGQKPYEELPAYMAHWQAAVLPFARNEATRFISPTKTPEYLAAGLPVVSTSIRDVVRSYGEQDLVRIADEPGPFIAALAAAMTGDGAEAQRWERIDRFLADLSWNKTWEAMKRHIELARAHRRKTDHPVRYHERRVRQTAF